MLRGTFIALTGVNGEDKHVQLERVSQDILICPHHNTILRSTAFFAYPSIKVLIQLYISYYICVIVIYLLPSVLICIS